MPHTAAFLAAHRTVSGQLRRQRRLVAVVEGRYLDRAGRVTQVTQENDANVNPQNSSR
jgi:hypothetical protein